MKINIECDDVTCRLIYTDRALFGHYLEEVCSTWIDINILNCRFHAMHYMRQPKVFSQHNLNQCIACCFRVYIKLSLSNFINIYKHLGDYYNKSIILHSDQYIHTVLTALFGWNLQINYSNRFNYLGDTIRTYAERVCVSEVGKPGGAICTCRHTTYKTY